MKKSLLMLLLVVFSSLLQASPVHPERARRTAWSFCRLAAPGGDSLAPGDLIDITSATPYTAFYLFSLGDKGFVIISADDCAIPVLGYSFTSPVCVKDMPAQIASWLQSCEEQIFWLRDNGIAPTPAVDDWWRSLAEGAMPVATLPAAVSPLITTTWDQNPYYNSLCPGSGTGANRAVTGCVATATAQVMKYWNHPSVGRGSHSYTDDSYGVQSADFGSTTYQWTAMPATLTGASSSTQVDAVATLMYHIGVAVEMDYGTESAGGSAAAMQCYGSVSVPSTEQALVTYFRYQPSLHCISQSDYTDAQWSALLCADLDAGRPVIYRGDDADGGHCFICDGYDTYGRFHFNWGWGGMFDGYFAIGSLNLSGGGTGTTGSYTFNLRNGALVGIVPMTSTAGSTTVTASANVSAYGSVYGGGTYASFTDTVSLVASASSGYRFDCWSDGYKYNPRRFVAPGGSHSFVAQFAPIAGDTVTYSGRTFLGSSQLGSPSVWGVRIPSGSLQSGASLRKVRLYTPSAGTYNLTVYKGAATPSTQLHTQSFTSTVAGGWVDFTLSSPVTVDATQSLFVTFTSSASYPVAYSYYSGNTDAALVKSGSSWISINDYGYPLSWMMDAVFSTSSSPAVYTLTVLSNNTAWGTVSGGGAYASGTTVTLRATAKSGYSFVRWNDGVTSATRTVTVTADATYTAVFAASGSADDADCLITSLPWNENFEGGLDCWRFIDADGDGKNWQLNNESTYAASGSRSVQSNSWDETDYGFQADNWLVSPKIQLPAGVNCNLTYYIRSGNDSYPDSLFILVTAGEGTSTGQFTALTSLMPVATSRMTQKTISLASWSGQTVRLAFRHYTHDGLCLFLDDVAVSSATQSIGGIASDGVVRSWSEGRSIVVGGAAARRVVVYDVLGRQVAASDAAADRQRFPVPHSGVYFISVDDAPACRVVVF